MLPGEVYTRLAHLDTLHVDSYLPVAERSKFTLGQPPTVTLEGGRKRTVTLEVIDPILDAATGTFGLRLARRNPDDTILAGSRCTLGPLRSHLSACEDLWFSPPRYIFQLLIQRNKIPTKW